MNRLYTWKVLSCCLWCRKQHHASWWGMGHQEHIVPMLQTLHWFPVAPQVQGRVFVSTYKSLKGLNLTYLRYCLLPDTASRTHKSAKGDLLQLPSMCQVHRAKKCCGLFLIVAPHLCNSLPFGSWTWTSYRCAERPACFGRCWARKPKLGYVLGGVCLIPLKIFYCFSKLVCSLACYSCVLQVTVFSYCKPPRDVVGKGGTYTLLNKDKYNVFLPTS